MATAKRGKLSRKAVISISSFVGMDSDSRAVSDAELPKALYLHVMKWFRRKNEPPWEVVGCECIDPVPMIGDDDDLDILRVSDTSTCGTYIFDIGKCSPQGLVYANAVLFARQNLIQEIAKHNYNILLEESWTLTLYRKGRLHRIEVQYAGLPACVSGKVPPLRPPPFMAVLESQHLFS